MNTPWAASRRGAPAVIALRSRCDPHAGGRRVVFFLRGRRPLHAGLAIAQAAGLDLVSTTAAVSRKGRWRGRRSRPESVVYRFGLGLFTGGSPFRNSATASTSALGTLAQFFETEPIDPPTKSPSSFRPVASTEASAPWTSPSCPSHGASGWAPSRPCLRGPDHRRISSRSECRDGIAGAVALRAVSRAVGEVEAAVVFSRLPGLRPERLPSRKSHFQPPTLSLTLNGKGRSWSRMRPSTDGSVFMKPRWSRRSTSVMRWYDV